MEKAQNDPRRRAPRVELDDYSLMLANVAVVLLNGDTSRGLTMGAGILSRAQIERYVVTASHLLHLAAQDQDYTVLEDDVDG